MNEENKMEYIQYATEIVFLGIMMHCYLYRLMIKWRFEDRVKHQMNAFKKASPFDISCDHVINVNVIPAGL